MGEVLGAGWNFMSHFFLVSFILSAIMGGVYMLVFSHSTMGMGDA